MNEYVPTDVEEYRAEMECELKTARIMQSEILPSADQLRRLQRKFGVEISAWFEPSAQISGDVWDAWQVGPTKLAICLVDFSTHGITAAMNTIRFFMLIRQRNKLMRDPAKYVEFLNKALCQYLLTHQFATIIYGILDTTSHSFTYAAAGSTQPLSVRLDTSQVSVGDRSGLPLGISRKATYINRSIPFAPGAALFLYSDAMTESSQANESLIGDDGVINILKTATNDSHENLSASNIFQKFFDIAVRPLNDDLTAVCLLRPNHPTIQ